MKAPAEFAQAVEDHPVLPPGDCERVSGYGIMGLPFASGHVLGLRRWTASSVGDRFTSIWHRNPAGQWTFYESAPCEVACSRYFGDDVQRFQQGPIELDWQAPNRLRVSTADGSVDWSVQIGATPATRMMSAIGSKLPLAAWRSPPILAAMGAAAGRVLGVGKVRLTGTTSNRQHFDANPLRVWYVTESHAVVEGEELGPIGTLDEQAHMADFYFPQRGIFAVGRVFITPLEQPGSNGSTESATAGHRAIRPAGFQGEYTLLADDGSTIVSCVTFESKDAYRELANDPAQDKWYQERIAPLLASEQPQWIDGTWSG